MNKKVGMLLQKSTDTRGVVISSMRKSIYLLKTTPSSHTHRFHPLPLATPIHSTHSPQLSSILKMEASHEQYSTHSETIKAAACEQYSKHPEKENVLPLDGTIALIVRKSVHTPENSIVIILPKKRLPHMHTWLSTVIIYVLKKELSMY